jgi:hypothetical protein
MGDFATWNTFSWLAVWALLLGASLFAIFTMIHSGRLSGHDQLGLMPPRLRAWCSESQAGSAGRNRHRNSSRPMTESVVSQFELPDDLARRPQS